MEGEMSTDKIVQRDQPIITESETIETLKEEIERLRAALRFYADSRNWSGKRTLKRYLREPEDTRHSFYFSNALRAKLGHGCVVALEALMNTSELWRFHGNAALEKTWNEIAKKYQKIAEENRELKERLGWLDRITLGYRVQSHPDLN
jgi:hypothetical protein